MPGVHVAPGRTVSAPSASTCSRRSQPLALAARGGARRRRNAIPAAPKPMIIINQVEVSGTAAPGPPGTGPSVPGGIPGAPAKPGVPPNPKPGTSKPGPTGAGTSKPGVATKAAGPPSSPICGPKSGASASDEAGRARPAERTRSWGTRPIGRSRLRGLLASFGFVWSNTPSSRAPGEREAKIDMGLRSVLATALASSPLTITPNTRPNSTATAVLPNANLRWRGLSRDHNCLSACKAFPPLSGCFNMPQRPRVAR